MNAPAVVVAPQPQQVAQQPAFDADEQARLLAIDMAYERSKPGEWQAQADRAMADEIMLRVLLREVG